VQVRHDEGVAIRIDPEPCAVARKGDSEASVGERIGPLRCLRNALQPALSSLAPSQMPRISP
jgi:hypothetical protein